jgi:hypothetical protein
MSPTTQALRSALADARRQAQRDKHEVICMIAESDFSAAQSPTGLQHHRDSGDVRAIVRPDEPILYCGLFPA